VNFWRVIKGMVMPGGWHYKVEGVRRPYEAISYDDLIAKELQYRLENGLPVGDVQQDVDEYICSTFPNQCHRVSRREAPAHGPTAPPRGKASRFIDHLIQWGERIYESQRIELVLESEANDRAKVCVECKLNGEWRNLCPNCVTRAEQLFGIIRQGRDVARWRKLKACRLYRMDTRTAVWLRDTRCEPDLAFIAPQNCWNKQ